MTIEEKRREIFELTHKDEVARLARIYGAQPSLEVAYDKNDDGLYISGLVQAAWWGFNAALDAVVIELPEPESPESIGVIKAEDPEEYQALEARMGAQYSAIHKCRLSIESTGLGLKVKS